MKYRYIHTAASVVILLCLVGCTSIPKADVQQFSRGVSSTKQQTTVAFQAISDLTSDSIINYAATQSTLNDALFQPVLDPQSVAMWDNTFSSLENYAQALVLLTSPAITTDYESAAVNLAGEIKQTGSDLQNQKLISSAPSVSASFAAAFTELGDILIKAKAQHDARAILTKTDPAVRAILTTMAETIGTSITTPGLRATVHANWEQRKGNQQIAFLEAKTPTDKRAVAALYCNLMSQESAQDLALASLRKSLLSLADAHHALASSENADAASAVVSIEKELQNTINLANRFQSAVTSTH